MLQARVRPYSLGDNLVGTSSKESNLPQTEAKHFTCSRYQLAQEKALNEFNKICHSCQVSQMSSRRLANMTSMQSVFSSMWFNAGATVNLALSVDDDSTTASAPARQTCTKISSGLSSPAKSVEKHFLGVQRPTNIPHSLAS